MQPSIHVDISEELLCVIFFDLLPIIIAEAAEHFWHEAMTVDQTKLSLSYDRLQAVFEQRQLTILYPLSVLNIDQYIVIILYILRLKHWQLIILYQLSETYHEFITA